MPPVRHLRSRPDFSLEAEAGSPAGLRTAAQHGVAGIDEAGRGPLAGPVVAAAVVFAELRTDELLLEIDDSKVMSARRREAVYDGLQALSADGGVQIGVGHCSVEEIDRLNILQASLLAMRRAVDGLAVVPAFALVDGNRLPDLPCPGTWVVGGDRRSLSIAAASIVAKVTRDRIMQDLDRETPGYGWARNAGYPTAAHLDALATLGPTPHHRRSFRPVRLALDRSSA